MSNQTDVSWPSSSKCTIMIVKSLKCWNIAVGVNILLSFNISPTVKVTFFLFWTYSCFLLHDLLKVLILNFLCVGNTVPYQFFQLEDDAELQHIMWHWHQAPRSIGTNITKLHTLLPVSGQWCCVAGKVSVCHSFEIYRFFFHIMWFVGWITVRASIW